MKMIAVSHIFYVTTIASMLLLSSCGGGNSAEGMPADDDCTPSTNLSTDLEIQVDISGSISIVPVTNNSVSGCPGIGDPFDTSLFTTRFENTEDFDVWNCSSTDGSILHYALPSFDDFVSTSDLRRHGFEIDPGAEDLDASQQLYIWHAPFSTTSDNILLWTVERIGLVNYDEDADSEWTDITFATEDDMSFTSGTKGTMQCHRTVSVVDLAASRFQVPCRYRGPVSAC